MSVQFRTYYPCDQSTVSGTDCMNLPSINGRFPVKRTSVLHKFVGTTSIRIFGIDYVKNHLKTLGYNSL